MDPFEIDDLHERLVSIAQILPSWALTDELEARLKNQVNFPQPQSQIFEGEPELLPDHVTPEADFLYKSFQAVAKALPLWVVQNEHESRQQQAARQQPDTQTGENSREYVLYPQRPTSSKRERQEDIMLPLDKAPTRTESN